jgi:hypothetical protein
MNGFDKLCASLASLLAIVLLVLGILGLFTGCSAHFSLPPILGVLPAFVGWGIVRAVYFGWNPPRAMPASASPVFQSPAPENEGPDELQV